MNALTDELKEATKRAKLHDWLRRFTFGHPRVFSSSANHDDFMEQSQSQTSNHVLRVYGGVNRGSRLHITMRRLNRFCGNRPVGGATKLHFGGGARTLCGGKTYTLHPLALWP